MQRGSLPLPALTCVHVLSAAGAMASARAQPAGLCACGCVHARKWCASADGPPEPLELGQQHLSRHSRQQGGSGRCCALRLGCFDHGERPDLRSSCPLPDTLPRPARTRTAARYPICGCHGADRPAAASVANLTQHLVLPGPPGHAAAVSDVLWPKQHSCVASAAGGAKLRAVAGLTRLRCWAPRPACEAAVCTYSPALCVCGCLECAGCRGGQVHQGNEGLLLSPCTPGRQRPASAV